MGRYCHNHCHGGSRFCFWCLTFTCLAGETVSKLMSFLASWLIRSRARTSKCACTTLLQCNVHHASAVYIMLYRLSFTCTLAVYIINALHALLYPTMLAITLHGCKLCPFIALFPTLYSMYAGIYLDLHDGKYKSGAAGGSLRSPPACKYYKHIHVHCTYIHGYGNFLIGAISVGSLQLTPIKRTLNYWNTGRVWVQVSIRYL